MVISDTRTQFNRISALIKNSEMAQALALLKPILEKEPRNVEAWWLAANAAPTPEASIQACEYLLTIKSDYQPARKMITDIKLKQATVLLKQAQSAEALRLVQPVVTEQPDNVEALWLLARSVALPREAIEICLHILTLQPNHEGAKRLIETKQQTLAVAESRRRPKRSGSIPTSWLTIGIVGIVAVAGVGILIAASIVQQTASKLTMTRNLGSIAVPGSLPAGDSEPYLGDPGSMSLNTYTDSLPADGQHNYTFTGSAQAHFVGMLLFSKSTGFPGKAMILLDPNGRQIATGSPFPYGNQKGMAMIEMELPSDGTYTLRLTGMPGLAQGNYRLQLVVETGYSTQ